MPDFVLCWETFSLLFPSGKSFLFISSKSAVYQMLANFRHWGDFFAVFEHFWGEVGGAKEKVVLHLLPIWISLTIPCPRVSEFVSCVYALPTIMRWCFGSVPDGQVIVLHVASLNYYLDFSTALNPVPYYSLIRVWQLAVISVTLFISCCSLASYIYLS